MSPSVENIIFDIGRVIISYNEDDVIKAVLPESKHQSFYVQYFLKSSHWLDLDRGIVSTNDVIAKLSRLPEAPTTLAADIEHILDTFISHLPLLKGSQNLFEDLARRFPIYILSNFQRKPFENLLRLHPFLKVAKGMVVSAHVKLMKPEPAIYKHLTDTFALKPESCLFLDDRPENIATALTQGWQGIVFESASQAREELRRFGI